jgi:hypothetical protein
MSNHFKYVIRIINVAQEYLLQAGIGWQGPETRNTETPVHLLRSCEALNQARRDIFDGHDILPEGFVWYLPQIIRFLQQETDFWELMDQLK